MAIRWASDRIGERGAVALVTNGSWIDGNVDSGVRACLADEFTSIHVVNLRGNQRTQGERSRREGGKMFGQGSRAPVAISILVRNPDAVHEGCRIAGDRDSGIVNDPNAWFDDPRDLIAAIRRVVHLSVETVRIVGGLPEPFDDS